MFFSYRSCFGMVNLEHIRHYTHLEPFYQHFELFLQPLVLLRLAEIVSESNDIER